MLVNRPEREHFPGEFFCRPIVVDSSRRLIRKDKVNLRSWIRLRTNFAPPESLLFHQNSSSSADLYGYEVRNGIGPFLALALGHFGRKTNKGRLPGRIGREAITALSKTERLIYIHFSGQSHLSGIMDHLGCLARILRFLMTISWKPVNMATVPGHAA